MKEMCIRDSFVDGTLLINVTDELSPCCRCCDPCSCEAQYKIILDYDAGYTSESLPDCIYEAMCHFMNIFIAYQNKCGSLDECANMDRLAVGAVLKQKSVDYIVREWTIDNGSIDRFYVKLINKWTLATLSSLSLCKKVYTEGMHLSLIHIQKIPTIGATGNMLRTPRTPYAVNVEVAFDNRVKVADQKVGQKTEKVYTFVVDQRALMEQKSGHLYANYIVGFVVGKGKDDKPEVRGTVHIKDCLLYTSRCV